MLGAVLKSFAGGAAPKREAASAEGLEVGRAIDRGTEPAEKPAAVSTTGAGPNKDEASENALLPANPAPATAWVMIVLGPAGGGPNKEGGAAVDLA